MIITGYLLTSIYMMICRSDLFIHLLHYAARPAFAFCTGSEAITPRLMKVPTMGIFGTLRVALSLNISVSLGMTLVGHWASEGSDSKIECVVVLAQRRK